MLRTQASDPMDQSTLHQLEQADLLILSKQPMSANDREHVPEMQNSASSKQTQPRLNAKSEVQISGLSSKTKVIKSP